MGIFSRRIKDPVEGTLHVVSTSTPPSGGLSVWMVMDVVVSVPGQPSFPERGRFFVELDKFPHPGAILPIEASASNPKRFKILWDRVPSTTATASSQAQQLADSLNAAAATGATGTATPPVADGPTVISGDAAADMIRTFLGNAGTAAAPGVHIQRSVTVNGRPAEPGELQAFETLTGMDLDGDGVIGPNPNPPG